MTVQGLDHVRDVAAAHAADVDRRARFPREAIDAVGEAGLLGLNVPTELGGLGLGPAEACEVLIALAGSCASSGMVFTMHLCAVAALVHQNDGRFDAELREAAAGAHLSTLALSETATRSNFWVSMGGAQPNEDGSVTLDVEKSFVTSAGPANSYIVSVATPGRKTLDATDLYLVNAEDPGVEVLDWWQGSGLRGNSSAPMRFRGTTSPAQRLGESGGGRDTLLEAIIPWFQLGAACVSVGVARAAAAATRDHVLTTRLEHLDQSLGDQPVVRHGLGMMYARADAAAGFVRSVAADMAAGDASQLAVLQLKVTANEVALQVTDQAMRLGGGAAYSGRSPLDRLFRDARAGVVMAPTADMLYDMIGRVLTGNPPF